MFIPLRTAVAVALALFVAATLPAVAHDGVHVDDAYARISTATGAVFLTIANHAGAEDRLVAVSSPAAAKAALHTHIEDAGGVMLMREVPGGLAIPGHGQHVLQRGGDHVMLMGLLQPLTTGDTLILVLRFQNAGLVTVSVPVDNDRTGPDAGDGVGHPAHGAAARTD